MSSYLVNEIYPCLQGEGINLGKPSILVRFQICNLRCTWCDTPYTHTYRSDPLDPTDPHSPQQFQRLKLEELMQAIQSAAPHITHLILSGGEPTLQNLGLLMRSLGASYTAEVETNGTRIPHLHLAGFQESDYSLMQWNVSPKGMNAGQELVPEALHHWSSLAKIHPLIYFKFVLRESAQEEDMLELLNLVQEYSFPADRVIVMAEGTSRASQQAVWLHDFALKHNFRMSTRLHVLLFGKERGV